MSLKLIILPLVILAVANIIQPVPDDNPAWTWGISSSLGSLSGYGQLVCTTNGCISTQNTLNPVNSCNNNNPIANSVTSIPILSNIWSFFAGVGATLIGHTQAASQCFQQANTFFVFTYDTSNPNTGQFLLISVLGMIIGIAILGGIQLFGGNILNTGSIFVIIVGGGLLMIWIVLSGQALGTIKTIPPPYGGYLYMIMTTMYALGIITTIGTSGTDN